MSYSSRYRIGPSWGPVVLPQVDLSAGAPAPDAAPSPCHEDTLSVAIRNSKMRREQAIQRVLFFMKGAEERGWDPEWLYVNGGLRKLADYVGGKPNPPEMHDEFRPVLTNGPPTGLAMSAEDFRPPLEIASEVDFNDDKLLWTFLTTGGYGEPSFECLPKHPRLKDLFTWTDEAVWRLSTVGVAWVATYIWATFPVGVRDLEFFRGLPCSAAASVIRNSPAPGMWACVTIRPDTDEFVLSRVGAYLLSLQEPEENIRRLL